MSSRLNGALGGGGVWNWAQDIRPPQLVTTYESPAKAKKNKWGRIGPLA